MSLESWKAEFYPVPADEVEKKDAVAHSLRKWIGLRKRNIMEHDLVMDGSRWLVDETEWSDFRIGGETCSLCQQHQRTDSTCAHCPLKLHVGVTCSKSPQSPWKHWIDDLNPEPMIKALEETLAKEQE